MYLEEARKGKPYEFLFIVLTPQRKSGSDFAIKLPAIV
jgi:hypothetical protein